MSPERASNAVDSAATRSRVCSRFALSMMMAAASGLAAPARAEIVHLKAARDTTIYESLDGATSNGAGSHLMVGTDSNGKARRALVYFDVASSIPEGATVISATLSLSASWTADDTPQVVEIFGVLSAWGEGGAIDSSTPGGGGNATAGDATWVHTFYPFEVWNRPGGDFDFTFTGVTWVSGRADYSWTSTRMRDDVQRWLDDPTTNFGWLVRGEESSAGTWKTFFSHDWPAPNPMLTVTYTPPVSEPPEPPEPPAVPSCVPDPATLCLDDAPGDRRFTVRMRFASDRSGGFAGDAHPVQLADRGIPRGGLFWFFSADNPEAFVKVLNGCSVNQHYWLYFSATTDVGSTLDVIDEQTGHHYQRSFSDGVAVPVVQDVTALPCS